MKANREGGHVLRRVSWVTESTLCAGTLPVKGENYFPGVVTSFF